MNISGCVPLNWRQRVVLPRLSSLSHLSLSGKHGGCLLRGKHGGCLLRGKHGGRLLRGKHGGSLLRGKHGGCLLRGQKTRSLDRWAISGGEPPGRITRHTADFAQENDDLCTFGCWDLSDLMGYRGEGTGTPLQYLTWKIPWMEGPGGLQSMGSHRVGHDWSDLAAAAWATACQAPLSMGFSRWEPWSGLPFPSPGDLPGPGIKLASPAL